MQFQQAATQNALALRCAHENTAFEWNFIFHREESYPKKKSGSGNFGAGENKRKKPYFVLQSEAKHRRISGTPGPLRSSWRSSDRINLCSLERPQENQQGAGCTCQTKSSFNGSWK